MYFLEKVAEEILHKLNSGENFAVVCPNKRTIEYLKKFIARNARKTMFLPDFLTLGDLYSLFSPMKKADDLVLILDLFKVFRQLTKNNKTLEGYDFDSFQNVGEILLRDFNDIDNYLVDVNLIFRNISDYESIDYIEDILTDEQIETLRNFFAHFSKEKITEEKQYFMSLWSIIPQLYSEFIRNLKNKNIGYNGLIIRELLKNFDKKIHDINIDTFIFVGFNALTKAQQTLFLQIKSFRNALFYWDYDNFYYKNSQHEAGLFIRQNISILGDDLNIDRDKFNTTKNIKLAGFPMTMAQAKALPELLEITGTQNFDDGKTAVIMPDESLLFPILSALPDSIENINVTIGLPFNTTNTATLIFNWLKLLNKYSATEYLMIDDLLQFFDDKILSDLIPSLDKFIEELKEKNKIKYTESDLQPIDNEIITRLLSKNNFSNPLNLLDTLLFFANELYFLFKENEIEVEAVHSLFSFVLNFKNTLETDLAEDLELINTSILFKILMRKLNNIHLPFSGKTLDGLQVMTLMESRNLDFENIVLLNLNEGIMPPKPTRTSLISEFMRRSFGLPLIVYQDSIFAYLFYRLFHNAKNVVLAYSNVVSEKNGEISRFVQQLIYETDLIPEENRYYYSEKIIMPANQGITIYKNEEVYKKLSQYLEGKIRLSASALNTYISCPLKFYFHYIAKIKEPEAIETYEIDDLKFGSIYHLAMEKIYKDFVNKEVTSDDIKILYKKIDDILSEASTEILNNNQDAIDSGINRIISDVIKKYIKNTLDFDRRKAPFYILGLEKNFYTTLEFELDNVKHSVNFVAILDRIDEKNKVIQLIDYKTGSDEISFSNIGELFEQNKNHKAIFQLMLYTNILQKEYENNIIEPHIYKIREIRKSNNTAITMNKEVLNTFNKEIFEEFDALLKDLLSEIFDPETPFSQTEKIINCTYCPYNAFCQKI